MSANGELLQILKDAMDRDGAVSGRRMFGGVGVYFEGLFFAIIDDGVIFLKTSGETRPQYEAEHSRPFSYMTKKGVAALTTYWRLPDRLLDDSEELHGWLCASVAAAKQAAGAKAPPQRKARGSGRQGR
jgi:DNA transformation protein and related proteins